MRILVYGAGNIGRLYAARLQRSGHEVSLLARGRRLAELTERGIVLEEAASGARTATAVELVERLEPEDVYDLVLVALPKNRVPEVLPALARNGRIESFLFFCNNAEGPGPFVDALGRNRVLLGFPGAAGVERGGAIRFLITSLREQLTTVGELDGRRSNRIERIAEALLGAGFPTAICPNMDAWLKTHAAKIGPTAGALFLAGGDRLRLAADRDTLRLMLRGIREAFRVLHSLDIPITPGSHRIFEWLPERLLLAIARKQLESEEAAIKIGHARQATAEMKLLADEFRALARRSDEPTPALDRLFEAIAAAAEQPQSEAETLVAAGV